MVTNEMMNAFLSVVECGNLSMAAEARYVTQSSLSKQIKALEDEIGAQLLIRSKGHSIVTLTPYGEEFLKLARQWQRLIKEFDNVKNVSEIQEISIGAQDRMNIFTLRNLYNHILEEYPKIRLDTHTRHSGEIYSMMESHVLDVGFSSALLPTKNITATPLFEEPMLIISYQTPNLPKVINPEDLDPDLEIFSRWSDEFEIWHDQIWPGKRYRIHIGTTAMTPNHLCKPGRWAIMPVGALNTLMQNDDFSLHTLSIQTPVRYIYYLEQKDPRPSRIYAIETFKEEMLKYLKSDPYINLNPNL